MDREQVDTLIQWIAKVQNVSFSSEFHFRPQENVVHVTANIGDNIIKYTQPFKTVQEVDYKDAYVYIVNQTITQWKKN